jgi:hypothetical protein
MVPFSKYDLPQVTPYENKESKNALTIIFETGSIEEQVDKIMEYYSKEVFQQDSLQEMGSNFMRYLYKYGVYLLYLSLASLALYGVYKVVEKGFVASSQTPLVTAGLIFLLITYFSTFMNSTLNSKGLDMIKNLIFYLPCILTDFIQFLKKDYANTPSTSLVVFGMIVVYVILFYLIPFVQKVQYRN